MSGFRYTIPSQPTIDKDNTVGSSMDYLWDWSQWLEGDTIVSQIVSSDNAAVTVGAVTQLAGVVTAVVTTAAKMPEKTRVRIACKITTSLGRIETRSIWLELVTR